ncbi:MAG: sigma 54-interacting transcriptional regulator [Candidatus Cloacimonetes bacterium]|nr:sigma 54-interacting transcriptional regulator [Candidatus Cloacimonadota bacterium]
MTDRQYYKKTDSVEIWREAHKRGYRVMKRCSEPTSLVRAQIRAEIDFYARHRHPAFAELLEHSESDGAITLVYEWFDGLPLDVYLERHPQDATFLWERLFHLVRWLRHHNLFIGDLKPEHIRVRKIDGAPCLKLIDLTPHRGRLTLDWAAPEQVSGHINWKSNLYSAALLFVAHYSSPAEVKERLSAGRPLILPPECPLGDDALLFLAPDPARRLDNPDTLIESMSATNPPLLLPYEPPYASYLEFHQRLCDLFYTRSISCRVSFELYDRFCLQNGLRRPHELEDFVIDADHTVPLQRIIAEAQVGWRDGQIVIGAPVSETVYVAQSFAAAVDDMRDALADWKLNDSRRVWRTLEPMCRALMSGDIEARAEFLALPIKSFVWLHRYIIVRDFALAETLMHIMLAARDLAVHERGRLHFYLLQVNAVSAILPADLVSITDDELKTLDADLRRDIEQHRQLIALFGLRDLKSMQALYRDGNLSSASRQALYLLMDILYPHCPDDFDADIFRQISREVVREAEPNFLINLMTRARAHLKLPETFIEFLMLLALKVESPFQLSRVLFYLLSNTGKEDIDKIEQVLLFYDDLPLENLPRVMVTHLTVIRIYYYLLREQYDLCRDTIRQTIGQSHGYATCYMLQLYIECSFLDHTFSYSDVIETALETSAEDIRTFYPMRQIRFLLYRFGTDKDIERFCGLFGWCKDDASPRSDYQQVIALFEEGRYEEVLQLIKDGKFGTRFKQAESLYWGGLALERGGQVQQAHDCLFKAREMFAGMGLEHRASQAAGVLDQWERMRQKLNRSNWQDIIQKFSQFTELEPFLAEMESLVQHLFRFETVIPFLYETEADRFLALRQVVNQGEEDFRALEYSNHILQLYKTNVFRVLRFGPEDHGRNESIQTLGIFNAMCVPVVVGRRLLGTIYMHTANADHDLDDEDVSSIENLASILGVFLEKLSQTETQKRLRAITMAEDFHGFLGSSPAVAEVIRQSVTLARVLFPLLITGETGTGKEILARAIFHEGNYKGEMISLNINTVPRELFESELFGHVKGSFSGAVQDAAGKVALAEHGLLFLDEIGDLGPDMQTKLLRVLQERTYYPVGGKREMRTNARFVFATNIDLRQAVMDGTFREDLYYRISAFCINIPPLRERCEDIPPLVRHFTRKFLQIQPEIVVAPIPDRIIEAWQTREWRGNVRELENQVYKALLMPQDEVEHEGRETFELQPEEVQDVGGVVAAYLAWRKQKLGSAKAVMQELKLTRSTFYRLLANKKE